MLLIFLWSNTILAPSSPIYAYKWEIVGFRAAWVSVAQLPLIYCLSCKINLISLITGISYERLNWFHRWAARTLFLTVAVHWSFFFREWSIANFVQLELSMMPMVKYGFGAWSVIGWMLLTGFGYFRTLSHELFVLQHIAAASILLWLVHIHVPPYAAYHVWLAVGFVAFDWIGRTALVLTRNLHVLPILLGKRLRRHIVGYPAHVDALPHNYMSITVEGVDFSWRPGQHVYLTVPGCGMFGLLEAHPFTVANLPDTTSDPRSKKLKVYFKSHSGFTKRLLDRCLSREDQMSLRVLVSGPWGNPPLDVVQRSDSVILFATSTGASFTMPILQSIVEKPFCIRRVRFYWIVRHSSQVRWFEESMNSAIRQAQSQGIKLVVQVFVSNQPSSEKGSWAQGVDYSPRGRPKVSESDKGFFRILPRHLTSTPSSTSSNNPRSEKRLMPRDPQTCSTTPISEPKISRPQSVNSIISPIFSSSADEMSSFTVYSGRPSSLDDLIRPTVEESDGETAIVACGVGGFLAQLRNYTASLSDERAVHKGTGAQGIFLFTENYGW
jgi:NAD(P)H-flavin reductase